MSHGPDLEHLAAQWAEHPDGLGFAALADGMRKRGSAAEALAVVVAGVTRHPRHLPGHLVLARIRMDAGDYAAAEEALRAALGIDPAHPVVLEALAEASEAAGHPAAGRAWREALDAALPEFAADADDDMDRLLPADDEGAWDPLLTESLAALYHRQGHLERAHEVYAALARRDPANALLSARRDAIEAEVAARRPLPVRRASERRPAAA